LTFDEYQQLALRTATREDGDKFKASVEKAMGISGEAGEVTDLLKKVLCHGHKLDKNKLIKELGDVQWYVATNAAEYGISLKEIAVTNIEKLRQRYPEGFSQERSINRLNP